MRITVRRIIHTAIPKFQPTPAGFNLVMPHLLQMTPFIATAHTSEPTEMQRKPMWFSECGGKFGTFGRNCHSLPSGLVSSTFLRTAKRFELSIAQMPTEPTDIDLKRIPEGASMVRHLSPRIYKIWGGM